MSRRRDGNLKCALALVALLAAACSGAASGPSGSSGGTPGSGGATASGGATGSGGATATGGTPGSGGATASGGTSAGTGGMAGAGGMNVTSCDVVPTPRRTTGTIAEFPFDLVYNGQPFVYGESNAVAGGGTVVPLNVRFFVSDVMLLRAGTDPLPVDIVTAAGVPQPYGVHFFNAEEPSSRVMRVLVPPGGYTGITFLLGLADACNSSSAAGRAAPLWEASQMSWPPPFGYLFLRYEGRNTPPGMAGAPPSMIHMGGLSRVLFAPRMRVEGALAIPEGGPGSFSKSVQLVMDQVFLAATADTPPPTGVLPPGDAALVGDRLLRNAASFPLFLFGP